MNDSDYGVTPNQFAKLRKLLIVKNVKSKERHWFSRSNPNGQRYMHPFACKLCKKVERRSWQSVYEDVVMTHFDRKHHIRFSNEDKLVLHKIQRMGGKFNAKRLGKRERE